MNGNKKEISVPKREDFENLNDYLEACSVYWMVIYGGLDYETKGLDDW